MTVTVTAPRRRRERKQRSYRADHKPGYPAQAVACSPWNSFGKHAQAKTSILLPTADFGNLEPSGNDE